MAKKKYYQRKDDGLFETTRTVNGKRVRFRGKTCAEVDRKILAYNEEKKKGRKVPKIIDEWWAQHEKEVSVSTQGVYKGPIERISAAFPDYASKYTAMDVARYIRDFEAKGYAAQTVGVELTVLKQIFSYAVLAGDIAVSPATEVKPGKNLRRKKRPALTVEQEKAVEAYRGDDWLLGLMLLYTGCRKGELLALTWQDVDREAGVIHVTKKVNYATGHPVMEDHLKSANGKRDIPLLDALAKVLPKNRIGLIFPGPDGGLLMEIGDTLYYDVVLKRVPPFTSMRERTLQMFSEVMKTGVIPPQVAGKLMLMLADIPNREDLILEVENFYKGQQPAPVAPDMAAQGQATAP